MWEKHKNGQNIGNKATRTVLQQSFKAHSVSTVFQVARPHIHHIQDKNDFKERKFPAANMCKNKRPQTKSQDSEKKHGRFNIPQKQVLQYDRNTWTEGIKLEHNTPTTFANEVTCFIHFFKVFECASSHAHHIEDENDSLESKKPSSEDQYVKNARKNYIKNRNMHRIIQYSSETSSTQKTETNERREKNFNMEQPQLFAIRGICRIQIWNVFQVTTPLYTTLNIEGKNDFIESKI